MNANELQYWYPHCNEEYVMSNKEGNEEEEDDPYTILNISKDLDNLCTKQELSQLQNILDNINSQ